MQLRPHHSLANHVNSKDDDNARYKVKNQTRADTIERTKLRGRSIADCC